MDRGYDRDTTINRFFLRKFYSELIFNQRKITEIDSKFLEFEGNCTKRPSEDWDIPSIDDEALPDSYEICLTSTPLIESDLSELVDEDNESFPGIYILYSKIKNKQKLHADKVSKF